MPSFLADNAHYLLLAIIGVWFAARFLSGPGKARGGLAAMFRREREVVEAGLDAAAIQTLLEDSRSFARARPDLRGLMLAGPFAGGIARPDSPVTLVFLAEATAPYAEPGGLASWPYPGRGHAILDHRIEGDEAARTHHLVLKGAPPIVLVFLAAEGRETLPPALAAAMQAGMKPIDDPAGLVAALAKAWRETPLA